MTTFILVLLDYTIQITAERTLTPRLQLDMAFVKKGNIISKPSVSLAVNITELSDLRSTARTVILTELRHSRLNFYDLCLPSPVRLF